MVHALVQPVLRSDGPTTNVLVLDQKMTQRLLPHLQANGWPVEWLPGYVVGLRHGLEFLRAA